MGKQQKTQNASDKNAHGNSEENSAEHQSRFWSEWTATLNGWCVDHFILSLIFLGASSLLAAWIASFFDLTIRGWGIFGGIIVAMFLVLAAIRVISKTVEPRASQQEDVPTFRATINHAIIGDCTDHLVCFSLAYPANNPSVLYPISCAAFVNLTNISALPITIESLSLVVESDDGKWIPRPMIPVHLGRMFNGANPKSLTEVVPHDDFCEKVSGRLIQPQETLSGSIWFNNLNRSETDSIGLRIRSTAGNTTVTPLGRPNKDSEGLDFDATQHFLISVSGNGIRDLSHLPIKSFWFTDSHEM